MFKSTERRTFQERRTPYTVPNFNKLHDTMIYVKTEVAQWLDDQYQFELLRNPEEDLAKKKRFKETVLDVLESCLDNLDQLASSTDGRNNDEFARIKSEILQTFGYVAMALE